MFRTRDAQSDQELPVNLYDDGHELVAILPMPGLTPDEIEIEVVEHDLVIHGRQRGPRQDARPYLLQEWHYGPFHRAVPIPFPVDAARANAAHGNGVLSIALPKSTQHRPGAVRLGGAGNPHQTQGHAGRAAEPRP